MSRPHKGHACGGDDNTPSNVEIKCPKCGHLNEVWKDELEIKCTACHATIKV